MRFIISSKVFLASASVAVVASAITVSSLPERQSEQPDTESAATLDVAPPTDAAYAGLLSGARDDAKVTASTRANLSSLPPAAAEHVNSLSRAFDPEYVAPECVAGCANGTGVDVEHKYLGTMHHYDLLNGFEMPASALSYLTSTSAYGSLGIDIPNIGDVPCHFIPDSPDFPNKRFMDIPAELCAQLQTAEVCTTTKINSIYGGAAAGADVRAVNLEFFVEYAESRGHSVAPLGLQRGSMLIISKGTCAALSLDPRDIEDKGLRMAIIRHHLTFIHEAAHIVDFKTGYAISELLEQVGVAERGIGHAHGNNEYKELLAFCMTTLMWDNKEVLSARERAALGYTYFSEMRLILERCGEDNARTTRDVLAKFGVDITDPYFEPMYEVKKTTESADSFATRITDTITAIAGPVTGPPAR